ncbi:MAG: hypothetical protein C0621_03390 [Desulfuromonas sp.]|nr:MAG: hypothetical protein C0621_03390 [Desulfuromonas sp.]
MTTSALPFTTRLHCLLRAFLLQGSWNFERMQSLGVLYALLPGLRRIYPAEQLPAEAKRHLDYFNSHPFLAASILGATLNLEQERQRGGEGYLGVDEFKRITMAPYAAMGDAFFWGGIRPFAAGIALFFAVKESLWAPMVFLTLFNLPHLLLRVGGFFRGCECGLELIDLYQRLHLPDLAIRFKEGTVILLGGLCGYQSYLVLTHQETVVSWGLLLFPLVLIMGGLVRRGISPLLQVLSLSTLLILGALIYR